MSTSTPRILVAGIGNIFMGDDAFGVEVVRVLSRRSLPRSVRLVDFGIRGLDLAYALLDGYDLTILIDATVRGGPPGTLYTLEPELPDSASGEFESHGMTPVKVLALASRLGGTIGRVVLVGCEPAPLDPGMDPLDIPEGLSTPVSRAVEAAADRVVALIQGAIPCVASLQEKE
jgi:hydrogenase maturation protease